MRTLGSLQLLSQLCHLLCKLLLCCPQLGWFSFGVLLGGQGCLP